MRLLERARERVRSVEDWWFDTTRRVSTAAGHDARRTDNTVGEIRDSYVYLPARAASVRTALRRLPIRDPSQYTFVDIGSGKGRILFIAAELPFAHAIGVEFDGKLHSVAERNIATCRSWSRKCATIEPILANAAEYEFPDGPLVVCLFNPFGPEIMARMLDNLERSFHREPRHIVLLMLWPEHADVAARRLWLREVDRTPHRRIFETGGESPAA